MSNQFIGLTMLVTLSSPYGAQLKGVVSSVVPGQSLTLRDVLSPATGKYIPEFTIKASEIVELVEARNEVPIPTGHAPSPNPVSKPKTLEDPAIVSVGKRPTPVQHSVMASIPNPPRLETPVGRQSLDRGVIAPEERLHRDSVSSSLVDPLRNISIQNAPGNGAIEQHVLEELEAAAPEPEIPDTPLSKSTTKRRRRKIARKPLEDSLKEHDAMPAKETTRSKGWRQTPLLEPSPSFQPFSTLKRRKGRGKVEENGWATEDATDVQDMGDFDFAGGLAKFDKHTIFTQIQAEDEIRDEDRLVAHNRLPKAKPGTAGGKNLHYTENVLDMPNGTGAAKTDTWQSEAGETEVEERVSERDTGSGRHSRRGESRRATSRKPISRKGSAIASTQMNRSNTITSTTPQPSFFLVPSERRCEPISSLQMLNLENIATNELGLSEDMMSENAGRGIAEVAMSALKAAKSGRIQGRTNGMQTVVVFAGNNRSGVRAVAGARQLQNHGLNVLVTVLGLERESELLAELRRQLKVFRNFGGKVLTKIQLFDQAKVLESPVDLIIDGLLGLAISFEELRTGEQATAYELIEWANRGGSPVLAIDIPTGIDPSSGKISIIDGRQLYIHSKYVVAMGAPKKGLLEAMAFEGDITDEERTGRGRDWQLFVADIGLGAAVWKKAGTRVRRGVDFEGSWVLGMRFQRSTE